MTEETKQNAEKSLMDELGFNEAEIVRRRAFLELGDDDIQELVSIRKIAQEYADPVLEAFYKHLLSFDETRAFFQNPKLLEHVKQAQKAYFAGLTEGAYDKDYIEDRLKIGAIHERIGLPVKAYMGMYNFYLRNVANYLFEEYKNEPGKALRAYLSLLKVVFLDIGLAIDTYISRREQLIGKQREAMRELPTQEALSMRGGVVGYQLPPLHASHLEVTTGDLLIFATDGISSDFAMRLSPWDPMLRHQPVQEIADRILARFGKLTDDALVLVIRYLGSAP
ncbi:MAG: protoglobin domain-containing protein [Methylococcales bacterium]|nr:protoglobin domain-containing protein [Methylococcales bacterium]